MTGEELATLRKQIAANRIAAFGRALGYEGSDASVRASAYRVERMAQVPGTIARLAKQIAKHPRDFPELRQ